MDSSTIKQQPTKPIHTVEDLKSATKDFLDEIGIQGYAIAQDGTLTIPQGWKGRYKAPLRELTIDEQILIDYIEEWG